MSRGTTTGTASSGAPARALDELASVHAARGFRIALGLLRDRGDAEDAVQEALARAAAAHGSLDDPAALPGWFLRVVVNLCMRILRRRRLKRRALALIGIGAPTSSEVVDPRPLADAQLSTALERARLRGAMDALPEMQKAAIVLRYGEELGVAEIAGLLGIGAGTVKTHLHRGLERLRKELA